MAEKLRDLMLLCDTNVREIAKEAFFTRLKQLGYDGPQEVHSAWNWYITQ